MINITNPCVISTHVRFYTPSVIYCPRVLRDIILLFLKDAHVMYSGVADKIQPYRIEIVVAGVNLKTAYSYILENFHSTYLT